MAYQATINHRYYANKKNKQNQQLVRELHNEGKTNYEISEETGLSEWAIRQILHQE